MIWLEQPDRESLASVMASEIAAAISDDLEAREVVGLALAGGSTPGPMISKLAGLDLDWERVFVTLTDERWVGVEDPLSNEGALRARLAGPASRARVVGLKTGHGAPEDAVGELEQRIAHLPRPWTFCVLGMGSDGHFASLFPGDAALDPGLSLEPGAPDCVPARPGVMPTARISLSLKCLLDSRRLALLITGAEKKHVLQSGDVLPVHHLAAAAGDRLRVFWSP